jgi:putative transposase
MKAHPFIEAEKAAGHSVKNARRLLEVSRAAYYQRRQDVPSAPTPSSPRRSRPSTPSPRAPMGPRGSTRPCASRGSSVASAGCAG